MYSELYGIELWLRKLTAAGFVVSKEPYDYRPIGISYCTGCDRPLSKCRCMVKR